MGTPEFAAPYLPALMADGHTISLVVTQPDRPKGRGQQLAASPVKLKALELGLEVAQPVSLRTPEFHGLIAEQKADVLVVVAFRILPATLFPLARLGAVNVHGSLLPKYRGAAPIQWAIAEGERETGVTIFQLDAEIDHGALLASARLPIGPDENAGELFARLSALGLDLLRDTLPKFAAGTLPLREQAHGQATPAPKLKKEDGLLDFSKPSVWLHNRVRAMNPYPVCYATLEPSHRNLRVYKTACLAEGEAPALRPGELAVDAKHFPLVGTGDGALRLLEVQLEGRPRVSGAEFVNGLRGLEGMRLQGV